MSNELLEKLWCVASDFKSVIDQHPYGSIRRPNYVSEDSDEVDRFATIIQESESYKFAVTVLQEVEQQLFGKTLTMPMTRELAAQIEAESATDSTLPEPTVNNMIPAENGESVVSLNQ